MTGPEQPHTPGIPASVAAAVSAVLRDCAPIGDDHTLRALFFDQRIAGWRDAIPGAVTPNQRLNALITALYKRFDTKGNNALVLFLEVIADTHDPGDICRRRLTLVAGRLRDALPAPPEQERICSRCQHANRPTARFCAKCGNPLPTEVANPLAAQAFSAATRALLQGDYWEAVRLYDEVLEIDPHYPRAREQRTQAKSLLAGTGGLAPGDTGAPGAPATSSGSRRSRSALLRLLLLAVPVFAAFGLLYLSQQPGELGTPVAAVSPTAAPEGSEPAPASATATLAIIVSPVATSTPTLPPPSPSATSNATPVPALADNFDGTALASVWQPSTPPQGMFLTGTELAIGYQQPLGEPGGNGPLIATELPAPFTRLDVTLQVNRSSDDGALGVRATCGRSGVLDLQLHARGFALYTIAREDGARSETRFALPANEPHTLSLVAGENAVQLHVDGEPVPVDQPCPSAGPTLGLYAIAAPGASVGGFFESVTAWTKNAGDEISS